MADRPFYPTFNVSPETGRQLKKANAIARSGRDELARLSKEKKKNEETKKQQVTNIMYNCILSLIAKAIKEHCGDVEGGDEWGIKIPLCIFTKIMEHLRDYEGRKCITTEKEIKKAYDKHEKQYEVMVNSYSNNDYDYS